MRASFGQPFAERETQTAATRPVTPTKRQHHYAPTISTVWLDALAIFVLHAPAILLVACICIAGPAMLCLLAIGTDLRLAYYAHASGPLTTWQGITMLQGSWVTDGTLLLLLQAMLGAIGLAFARGVIARLALSDVRDAPSLRLACREAKARFGSLLTGSLVYGISLTFGAVGINAALLDIDLDLSLVGEGSITPEDHAHMFVLQTLNAFVPSPGSPFAEFVPVLRHSSFMNITRESGSNQYWQYVADRIQARAGNPSIPSTPVEESISPALAISLVSVGALLLAEALLRFTPIMAMFACGRTRLGAITPVLRSIRFGIRNFGAITKHVAGELSVGWRFRVCRA